jgi:hypothetical protein
MPPDIKRIYDVLSETEFKNLLNMVDQIPYSFQPYLNEEQDTADKACYFATTLFNDYVVYYPPVFEVCRPLLLKLDVKSLRRMKINLFVGESKIVEHAAHRDTDFKCKAFVFYLNTNNGYTKIGDIKIPSIENTGVKLDSNALHHSTNCTDKQRRLTLNLNYF